MEQPKLEEGFIALGSQGVNSVHSFVEVTLQISEGRDYLFFIGWDRVTDLHIGERAVIREDLRGVWYVGWQHEGLAVLGLRGDCSTEAS